MTITQSNIVFYTVPVAACDSKKTDWNNVAVLLKNLIETNFGQKVSFEHIEFMSQAWFKETNPQILLKEVEML